MHFHTSSVPCLYIYKNRAGWDTYFKSVFSFTCLWLIYSFKKSVLRMYNVLVHHFSKCSGDYSEKPMEHTYHVSLYNNECQYASYFNKCRVLYRFILNLLNQILHFWMSRFCLLGFVKYRGEICTDHWWIWTDVPMISANNRIALVVPLFQMSLYK